MVVLTRKIPSQVQHRPPCLGISGVATLVEDIVHMRSAVLLLQKVSANAEVREYEQAFTGAAQCSQVVNEKIKRLPRYAPGEENV